MEAIFPNIGTGVLQAFYSDLENLAVFLGFCTGLAILVAGAMRKVVVFYDTKDMGLSLLALIMPLIAYATWTSTPFQTSGLDLVFRVVVPPLNTVAALVLIVNTIHSAAKHNRSILLGIPIGIFKIVLATFAAMTFIEVITKALDKNAKRREVSAAAFLFLLTAIVTGALINGPAVYASKGWPLPDVSPNGE